MMRTCLVNPYTPEQRSPLMLADKRTTQSRANICITGIAAIQRTPNVNRTSGSAISAIPKLAGIVTSITTEIARK